MGIIDKLHRVYFRRKKSKEAVAHVRRVKSLLDAKVYK